MRPGSSQNVREDDLELAVDAAIVACDGNMRAAMRALVIANSFLYGEVDRLQSMVSSGFARGKLSLRDLP